MDWLEELRKERKGYSVPARPRPLRLLYVATSTGEGGIERSSVEMAAHFRARGCALTYVCQPGSLVASLCHGWGIPMHAQRIRNSGDLLAAWQLAGLIVSKDVDVVHVHSRRDFVPALAAVAMARCRGGCPRLVLHAHLAKPLGLPGRLSGRFFQRGADAVIAVSDAVRRLLLDTHGLPPSFVHRIYNGVDRAIFAPKIAGIRSRMRADWGIPDDALVVGMLGRLNAKGQDGLLAAAPQLLAQFPSLYFVLVGPDGRGGDRARLKQIAQGAGLGTRVVLPGTSIDVAAALAAFDVFAHLPAEEAFGLALAEAMAAGLPTVATSAGGCREVVRNGTTGYLVRLGDKAELVSALTHLLGSKSLRVNLGAAGRRVALESFSMERQIDDIKSLYQRLTPILPERVFWGSLTKRRKSYVKGLKDWQK